MCNVFRVVCEVNGERIPVAQVDRYGVRLDRSPDQADSILFESSSAAACLVSALMDLSLDIDDPVYVVEPYALSD